MLKQLCYINLGLQDSSKSVYYLQCGDNRDYVVFVDSGNCENANMPIYTIDFQDNHSAARFAYFNMQYDKQEFNIFVEYKRIVIEPRTVEGVLKIDCRDNEEVAKKFVKMFREQYIRKLDMCKQSHKNKKDDFNILMH